MSKRNVAIAVGIMLTIIVVVVFLLFLFDLLPFTKQKELGTEQPKFDIQEAIAELQSGRSSWNKYSVQEYDWKVWKKQADGAGATFVKMDSWGEFEESLKQNSHVWVLILDEENRVIWYNNFVVIIYLYY